MYLCSKFADQIMFIWHFNKLIQSTYTSDCISTYLWHHFIYLSGACWAISSNRKMATYHRGKGSEKKFNSMEIRIQISFFRNGKTKENSNWFELMTNLAPHCHCRAFLYLAKYTLLFKFQLITCSEAIENCSRKNFKLFDFESIDSTWTCVYWIFSFSLFVSHF